MFLQPASFMSACRRRIWAAVTFSQGILPNAFIGHQEESLFFATAWAQAVGSVQQVLPNRPFDRLAGKLTLWQTPLFLVL